MHKPVWMWVIFLVIIGLLIAIDLGAFNRKQKEINLKHSLLFSLAYITIALIFGCWLWYKVGAQGGAEYFTGFLIEKCLSFDNIFVISVIFSAFSIPRKHQHRILFLGIIGAIILRAIMIGLGTKLISELHWALYILALFLIITGIKMLLIEKDKQVSKKQLKSNWLLQYVLSFLPKKKDINTVTNTANNQNNRFYFIKTNKKTGTKQIHFRTSLLALITIEFADIFFALDSVPAILAITTDTYVIYTSNIFAILGLRALYFAVSAIIPRFYYLKYSIAIILIFIGSKIFIADIIRLERLNTGTSLIIVIMLLSGGVLFSIYKTKSISQHKNKS